MKRLPELIPLIPSLPFSFWEEGGGAEVCRMDAWSGLSWYPSRLFRPPCKAFSKRGFQRLSECRRVELYHFL